MQLHKGEDVKHENVACNASRDPIANYDKLFTNNVHDKHAFRQFITFPEDFFPIV